MTAICTLSYLPSLPRKGMETAPGSDVNAFLAMLCYLPSLPRKGMGATISRT
ncbi:hypothetical protein [Nostoc parmelioides]|uniref:Uncharacterized protein n=1 Tax=Nostoc parmelioides FACHB-3921 TaxID=2692909 RepID=A0ABR8BK32_9NOSO|nr:hypothetical protein [Nostoc parmelioides]MBD2254225.1 hypothetical protein [Nostoc parmelioides FACHB-3921]